MRLRLTPHETVFYDLFTASAANVLEGAKTLRDLISAQPHERDQLYRKLREQEHHGDDRTHSILREVNSTFVTPIDREDIYALASALDDIVDFTEEVDRLRAQLPGRRTATA